LPNTKVFKPVESRKDEIQDIISKPQNPIEASVPKIDTSVADLSYSSSEEEKGKDKFIGRRIKVFWPNHGWYEGKVVATSDNPQEGTHEILYDDSADKGPVYEHLLGNKKAEYKLLLLDISSSYFTGGCRAT